MKRKFIIKFLFGFLLGLLIPYIMKRGNVRFEERTFCDDEIVIEDQPRQLLFIGVMTAQKFLDTRAVSMYKTWGQEMKDSLLFFSGSNVRTNHELPLVNLPTVDDSYPPQKKSFLMLKYMSDILGDKYEWFLRADDDVFIDIERLKALLSTLDCSKLMYIGQAGVGNRQEFGLLNLNPGQNFCMGGPGVVFSRTALKELVTHIPHCLQHLESSHEDVEVGRCVNKFLNISCSWSYEMQQLFYHNFSGEIDPKNVQMTEIVRKAITLHPVKQVESILEIYTRQLQFKHLQLRSSLLVEHKPKSNSLETWDFIQSFHYSTTNNNPKRGISSHLKSNLNENYIESLMEINKESEKRGRSINFKALNYGYYRMNQLRGVDYILDMYVSYRKHKGKKFSSTVRKHVTATQTFSQIQVNPRIDTTTESNTIVNIILPLSGRLDTFRKFLSNFRTLYSTDKYLSLAVIMFPKSSETQEAKSLLVDMMRENYPVRLAQLTGSFSRAAALQRGAALFNQSSLIFFLDVDMMVSKEVLQRVRLNTILGKQAYFPIIFSQYHPDFVLDKGVSLWNISNDAGHWRQFGYGIVSLFNKDFTAAGGMNVAIKGWGKEDVDFFERLLRVVQVFRAPDPGLIHIYHESNQCDQSLSPEQRRMCQGSKLNTFGSKESLSRFLDKSTFNSLF